MNQQPPGWIGFRVGEVSAHDIDIAWQASGIEVAAGRTLDRARALWLQYHVPADVAGSPRNQDHPLVCHEPLHDTHRAAHVAAAASAISLD